MEWKPATKNDQGLVNIPKRWLHIHYYEALNILFRFENSLRVFVYAILKNEYSSKWEECNFSMPGGNTANIKSVSAKRITQADNFGYLGFDIKARLMHLTSGELVELITADAYWPKFKGHFKGNKEIIKNKLLEIGTIRNSLAHFRPMRAEDVGVVKQNSRHTLLGVEACLANLFAQSLRVPTNTTETWYQSISTLGTKQIITTPFYSANEEWVNIKLTFKSPILNNYKSSENFYHYQLVKINPPAILSNYSGIRDYVTYISESLSYPLIDENSEVIISKDMNLVFRKDVLIAQSEKIAKELSNILLKVSEECDLLSQDSLARGSLVEPASGMSWWQAGQEGAKGRWIHHYEDLSRPYEPSDPDEYWGAHSFTSDVVAGCPRYPWMPADISDIEGIFDF